MKKGLIVSIQGYSQPTTQELAEKAILGGAVAIRTDMCVLIFQGGFDLKYFIFCYCQ